MFSFNTSLHAESCDGWRLLKCFSSTTKLRRATFVELPTNAYRADVGYAFAMQLRVTFHTNTLTAKSYAVAPNTFYS